MTSIPGVFLFSDLKSEVRRSSSVIWGRKAEETFESGDSAVNIVSSQATQNNPAKNLLKSSTIFVVLFPNTLSKKAFICLFLVVPRNFISNRRHGTIKRRDKTTSCPLFYRSVSPVTTEVLHQLACIFTLSS